MKMANKSGNTSKRNERSEGKIERKMEPAVPFGIAMHQAGDYNVIDFLSMPMSKDECQDRKAFASIIIDEQLAIMLLGASVEVLKNSKDDKKREHFKNMISKLAQSNVDK